MRAIIVDSFDLMAVCWLGISLNYRHKRSATGLSNNFGTPWQKPIFKSRWSSGETRRHVNF
jgi:hypothetical protein